MDTNFVALSGEPLPCGTERHDSSLCGGCLDVSPCHPDPQQQLQRQGTTRAQGHKVRCCFSLPLLNNTQQPEVLRTMLDVCCSQRLPPKHCCQVRRHQVSHIPHHVTGTTCQMTLSSRSLISSSGTSLRRQAWPDTWNVGMSHYDSAMPVLRGVSIASEASYINAYTTAGQLFP